MSREPSSARGRREAAAREARAKADAALRRSFPAAVFALRAEQNGRTVADEVDIVDATCRKNGFQPPWAADDLRRAVGLPPFRGYPAAQDHT